MIRIEILFDRQSTKNLKSGTLQALQNEIEQRLKPHYPEIWLRIDQGALLQIVGGDKLIIPFC
ncbi:DinI-like family protein [Salmonella enterica]|nr:DinI-like family protein [Salmonella enterica]